MSTIHQLHERCNDLEAELRERQGKAQLVAAIRARPSMEGVLEEFLEFEENPTEHDIAGWLGFGALGFHAKIDILLYVRITRRASSTRFFRRWVSSTQNKEFIWQRKYWR
eukprot:GHVN01026784.1.p1 GENE.GHVN01026784.1~~GHVN01026784.1.p1  ORF type:complete len:110 (+),score=11.20 GHVN01026784.1:410-739(+)